jgi:membrane protease YdiL (CAAX protease family)
VQDTWVKRGIYGILGFFGLWVFLTALLAHPVAQWVEGMAPGVFPFSRVFGRVQLGVALGLVPVLLWYWQDSPKGFFDISRWKIGLAQSLLWVGVGMGMVVGVAGLQVWLGVRKWEGVQGLDLWGSALATGCLVGVLEEFFFRGVLGMAWWKSMNHRLPGLLLTVNAGLFSLVHFIRPHDVPSQGWADGFLAWGRLELWSGTVDLWRLAGLVLAGLILSRIVWGQGNLWTAMGLHAGWVAGVRWANAAFPEVSQATAGWWGPSLESGPLPFLVLLLFAFSLMGKPIRAHLD